MHIAHLCATLCGHRSRSGEGAKPSMPQKQQSLTPEVQPDQIGQELATNLNLVLTEIEGCSMRPTDIARVLDTSRVMVSRLLSAIRKDDPIERLTRIPGPETLRSIVRAAGQHGVEAEHINAAEKAIEAFDELIREQFGTRSALNAALSNTNPNARSKFEQSSRYQVFKGMSQIVGAQSNLWLTTMMLTPSNDQPDGIDISTIHGTSGLRRLRPDTPIRFVYGVPPEYEERRQSPVRTGTDLSSFLMHEAAPLRVDEENGQIINTFAPEVEGKDDLYDMLAEVYIPNGSNRYAAEGRNYRGTTVIPDVPTVTLVSDVMICDDIFEGIEPELFLYNTMPRGGADIEDPKRLIDRVETQEQLDYMGRGTAGLGISEFPMYEDMVAYMCEKNRRSPDSIRTYRLQVQYPVYGFQHTIAFKVPQRGS